MFWKTQINKIRNLYNEYPKQFWLLMGAFFVDRVGGALIFPFFSLYVTKRFGVGLTEVGLLFGVHFISSIFGTTIGGALADRVGRKGTLIFGLLSSAFSMLLMGFVDSLNAFFLVSLFSGLFASIGDPAGQAMVADLLPEEKRSEGYGILRVSANLAVTIGPAIGGILAAYSYLFLFISDAVASTLTSIIIFILIKETRSHANRENSRNGESFFTTLKGYGDVLKNAPFMVFMVIQMLVVLVYMQMNTTLGVYLRDNHQINEQFFGYILSLNAAMVVLFQFPITRRIRKFPPMIMMMVGTLLYAIGFAMYGFVSAYAYFLLAMVVITIGEMLVSPVATSIVARFSPEDKRGRYMAAFGFTWIMPNIFGLTLTGLLMDNYDPRIIWYIAGVLGLIATSGYYFMYLAEKKNSAVLQNSSA
jgi:MFS family permease